MTEILLCDRPITSKAINDLCNIEMNMIHNKHCSKPRTLSALTPYMINPQTARELTNLSLAFGEKNTIALSEMTQQLQEFNIGLMGTSTSTYTDRMAGFAKAVKIY